MSNLTEIPDMQQPTTTTTTTDDVLMPDLEGMKHAKEMRELSPKSILVQLVKSSVELLVDFFKVAISSMLVVFVPQSCPLLNPGTAPPICYASGGLVPTNQQ